MNEIIINGMGFNEYIIKNNVFQKAYESLIECLKNWYEDDPKHFIEDMWADLTQVLQTYHFKNKIVAVNKNFLYEPALDYISISIQIEDGDGTHAATYTAFMDFDGNIFDDKLAK